MPRYFSERGRSHEEVIEKIRQKYGDRARIMMHKNVPASGVRGLIGREQVEITGYIAVGEEARKIQRSRDEEERTAILAAAGKPRNDPGPGSSGFRTAGNADSSSGSAGASSDKGGTGRESPEGNIDAVLRELRDLKGQLALGASTPPPTAFPVLDELESILRDNDFDTGFISGILDSLRAELRAADLENREGVHEAAASLIAERIPCYRQDDAGGVRVFVLVGPTGVGKTTTIAKLAAVNGLSSGGSDVRIFTVDSFRIGARAQVETYGEIMGIPVKAVDDYNDLKAQVALASDADLILVDTIGKSPRDSEKIEEMRHLLEACGEKAEVHLALSATTKTADLQDIMEQFEIFGYRSVILTKLDETSRVGNLISVLAGRGSPVSYLTDGQSVPVDIALASPSRLVSRLKGLDYDALALDQKYPAADLTAAWR